MDELKQLEDAIQDFKIGLVRSLRIDKLIVCLSKIIKHFKNRKENTPPVSNTKIY